MNKTADYVNRLVDGNALNDRLSAKDKTLQKVRAALSEGIFNKWQSYSFVFSLVDKRKITMREVCEIAELNGIPSGVLESIQADNYPIKPETLQLIKKLARGEPMPAKKGNT